MTLRTISAIFWN